MKYVELKQCKERFKEMKTDYANTDFYADDIRDLFEIAQTALKAWENQSALLAQAEEEIKRLRGK